MTTYKKGELYFRIKYPDRDMAYPIIESMVYVGDDILAEDTGGTCYFQNTASYVKFGFVTENPDGDRRVTGVKRQSVDRTMLNSTQLLEELRRASTRRHKTIDSG